MKYNTVIFDLDGTISDPFEGIFKCVNHALGVYDYDPVAPERVRDLIGPPLDEIFAALLGPQTHSRMLELVEAYRDRYARAGFAENVLYGDVAAVIRQLAESGVRMGICTSKRADYAAKILEMFGLVEFFEFIDGGDVHLRKVAQIRKLVANGVDAGSAVMIGDRAVDILAAAGNGVDAIGVTWGFGSREELDDARPSHVVDSAPELLELLI